jgi:release factor glutamine methyltransferase
MPLLPKHNPKPLLPKASNPTTIRQTLLQGSLRLTEALALPFNVARLESECLLGFVLGWKRIKLLTHDHELLQPIHWQAFETLLAQRLLGVPLAYLTQEQEFFGLPLKVNEQVLVPRPETELLVEKTLDIAKPTAHILDLGTGSGAIAIALAKSNASFHVVATDKSQEALDVAKENARRLHAHNILFVHSDWYEKINGRFDVICSNPPYIDENDPCLASTGVAFEPKSALIAKDHGLADLRRIIMQAPAYLNDNGALLVEHGHLQKEAVQAFFRESGFVHVETIEDLAGLDRLTLGFIKSS